MGKSCPISPDNISPERTAFVVWLDKSRVLLSFCFLLAVLFGFFHFHQQQQEFSTLSHPQYLGVGSKFLIQDGVDRILQGNPLIGNSIFIICSFSILWVSDLWIEFWLTCILLDGHNDLLIVIRLFYLNHIYGEKFRRTFENGGFEHQVDIPRLSKSQMGGTFWSAFVPCPKNGSLNFENENYEEGWCPFSHEPDWFEIPLARHYDVY